MADTDARPVTTNALKRFARRTGRRLTSVPAILLLLVAVNLGVYIYTYPNWSTDLSPHSDFLASFAVELLVLVVDIVLVLVVLPAVLRNAEKKRMAHVRVFILRRLRRDVLSISKNNWMYFGGLARRLVKEIDRRGAAAATKVRKEAHSCIDRAKEINEQGRDLREYLVLCMNALDPNELQTATNYLEKRERYFTRYIRQVEALASAFSAENLQHSKLANLAAQFDPHKAHDKGPANFWHISAELKQDVLSLVGLIQDDDVGGSARQWQGIDLDEDDLGHADLETMSRAISSLAETVRANPVAP